MDTPIHSDIYMFRLTVLEHCDSFQSTHSKSDIKEKTNKISDWVDEQKTYSGTETKKLIMNVGKVLTTTTRAIQKLKSEDPFNITSGTLDIISSVAVLFGGPYGAAASALCSIIGAMFLANKPSQPSVVEQLAHAVHNELINFNRKLQDQKYNGLKDRISEQKQQLQYLSREEKLDDPNLWNDYTQFLGELSERFESPLTYRYNENLLKDADVTDFVTALVMYCQAHTCFLALLTAAKGRLEDLGGRKDEKDMIDRTMSVQTRNARGKLAFLSDERYLTFLGRLPFEGGKLTKIVGLSRNVRAKHQVELVRGSLQLPKMPSETYVEGKATTTSKQRIKLRLEKYPHTFPRKYTWFQIKKVQFINDTEFPMKIVSGLVGGYKNNLTFVQDVQPYMSYEHEPSDFPCSTGGYITIYNDGNLRSSVEPEGDVRVIEFALSNPFVGCAKVNIQDKTDSEFTKGLDTYNNMHTGDRKTVYWVQDEVNYIAVADIVKLCKMLKFGWPTDDTRIWRFVVQEFDPTEDVEEAAHE